MSKPVVYSDTCYICNDPDFERMNLPLCRPCDVCGAHVAADETICIHGHIQASDPFDLYIICLVYGLPMKRELQQEAAEVIVLNDGETFQECVQRYVDNMLDEFAIGANIDGNLIEPTDEHFTNFI